MRLALVLPGVAIGFAAAVILGPGNTRPALGARVHVAPAVDGLVLSMRVVAVLRKDGAEQPATGVDLTVDAGGSGTTARTGADGVAEIAFPQPAARGSRVVVRANDLELAEGPLAVSEGRPAGMEEVIPQGRAEGEIRIRVVPERGQATPPFAEVLAIRLTRPLDGRDLDVAGTVTLGLVGASPATRSIEVDPREGPARVSVRAEAMRVEVEATARDAAGRTGTFSGHLETVPGALWLDPTSGDEVIVASPAPRPAAYLSLHTERGRAFGFSVPLTDAGDGFHRGRAPLPAGDRTLAVLVASGDAEERGPATVTWPLIPARGAAQAPRLERVLDGVIAAEAVERARAIRARRIAVGVAALCGLLSIALLVTEGRRAQKRLSDHLRAASEGADAGSRKEIAALGEEAARSGSATATLLGAVVALAFGIVTAMVLVR